MDVEALQKHLGTLDAEIDQQIKLLLHSVAEDVSNEVRSSLDEETGDLLDATTLNRLWVLRTGAQEVERLFEAGEYVACLDRAEVQLASVAKFDTFHPNSLLSVDITRRLNELKERSLEAISKIWSDNIIMGDTSLLVSSENPDTLASVIDASPSFTQNFIKSVGTKLITPIIDQRIKVEFTISHSASSHELTWSEAGEPSLELVYSNIEALISFCASLPDTLSEKLSRRWGTHLVHEILHNTLVALYPDVPVASEFKKHLAGLEALESKLKLNGWTHSNELSQFYLSFDSRWPDIRRESFLTKLRRLYQAATPISVASRQHLISLEADEDAPETSTNDIKDEWDWNEDDEEDEDEKTDDVDKEASAIDGGSRSSGGAVIELFRNYRAELDSLHPDPFFVLFRALTDSAYSNNPLWIYADTKAFIRLAHVVDTSSDTTQLDEYCNKQLRKYVIEKAEVFDLELLPPLFGASHSKAVTQIRSFVDGVAIATNDAGGPHLREYVLSQLVEQACVFIIRTVVQMRDIGDEESMTMAATISKLNPLALYFTNVEAAVPSWTKLERLREILSGNLTTIRDLHSRGMLADFSLEELRDLIEALFVESPLRNETIRDFYNQGI